MRDTTACLIPVGRVLLSLSLLGATAVAGEPLFPARQMERIQRGVSAIYNLEHGRAAQIYQAMIDESPDDPAGYTYLAKTYWLQELVSKQELSIDRFAASDFFAETVKYQPQVDPRVEQRFPPSKRPGYRQRPRETEKPTGRPHHAVLAGTGLPKPGQL